MYAFSLAASLYLGLSGYLVWRFLREVRKLDQRARQVDSELLAMILLLTVAWPVLIPLARLGWLDHWGQ